MGHTTKAGLIDRVYEILRQHGPATAIDFMQHSAEGMHAFPPSVLMQVNMELQAKQQSRRASLLSSRRESRE